MDALDCPACHRRHDEPAEAVLGLRVLCLDCYYDRERMESADLVAIARAA